MPRATEDLPKVLIAENDELVREMLLVFLEDMGFRVCCAANGQEAISLFTQDTALVILDINMPKVNGPDALRAIRTSKAHQAAVIMSGSSEARTREDIGNMPCSILLKPFSLARLQNIVSREMQPRD